MPNWTFIAVSFLYNLGLAIWIGGVVVLGALVAPRLFQVLDRETAGSIFGSVLRRFLRLRVVAIAVVLGAAIARFVMWETSVFEFPQTIWIIIRWMCLTFLASEAFYELVFLEGALGRALERRGGKETDGIAQREFGRLHRRSETLMKISLFAALGALILS